MCCGSRMHVFMWTIITLSLLAKGLGGPGLASRRFVLMACTLVQLCNNHMNGQCYSQATRVRPNTSVTVTDARNCQGAVLGHL